jgi:phosphatidylglycerol:prolipoprotein diacylglycerol transferase
MYNELLTVGPLTIYGYGTMIAIGILVAYQSILKRAGKEKLRQDTIFSLTIISLLGGFVGAKLLYWLTQLEEIVQNPSVMLNVSDGFVVYGGIIGGILSGYLYCRKKKLNFVQHLDLFVPSLALAQGFGRIGCLLAGCCYGEETTRWYGIVFHHSDFAPNGVKLAPTQVMESMFCFALYFVLRYVGRTYKPKQGILACMYLIGYSLGRFSIEFYRGDLVRGQYGALATSQWIAIGVIVLAILAVIARLTLTSRQQV